MRMADSIRSPGGVRRAPIGSRRPLMWLWVVLVNLALDCRQACAQVSAPAQDGDHPAESRPVGGATSIEELARRLQTLERQNAELAAHNRSLTHQLDKVTRRYDELNRRLERVEPASSGTTPPLPPASPPAPGPRPVAATSWPDPLPDSISDALGPDMIGDP